MIAAALVLVVAAALRIWTDLQVSAVNVGHRLPVTWGQFAVPLPRTLRWTRVLSSAAVLWGALALGSTVYDYRNPMPSVVMMIAIIVLALYAPSVVITTTHNRHHATRATRP
ncbi:MULTISPECIES: hypothetical protein [Nocardiaceae]|uniref:Uncharacterized protein n=1 Tax=Rhodococcoides corynebacterioides TaxID=53972 RepID=A0ABS2KU39_9NOCA|nr:MULTISPECIES: hypothetical protein [Rhodococcus]MBM7415454.1 hypothetical protein [Rhodococcus corynebacterioides]MBP1117916.1 hypothetical protein [Rhodococcus sp. PvP016]